MLLEWWIFSPVHVIQDSEWGRNEILERLLVTKTSTTAFSGSAVPLTTSCGRNMNLMDKLNQLNSYSSEGIDLRRWTGIPSGEFLVRSVYLILNNKGCRPPCALEIWHSFVSSKPRAFFNWLRMKMI